MHAEGAGRPAQSQPSDPLQASPPARRRIPLARKLLYALVPVCLLVAAAEIGLRLAGLDRPHLYGMPIGEEDGGLEIVDFELFWAMKPSARIRMQGVTVTTNSLGLRTAEVGEKTPREFRILCLGESTTFGASVEDDEPYPARLERMLNAHSESVQYRVINAGVSAYTSFQSLEYLKLRGLKLQPDLVIVYHEINDFLPTNFRSGPSALESDLHLSDREKSKAQHHRLHRRMQGLSAIYRYFYHQRVKSELDRVQRDAISPAATKQLLRRTETLTPDGQIEWKYLPTRVTAEERREFLREFQSICAEHGIGLVMMHPSYRGSTLHECELTRFCRERNVPMLETYELLHPSDGADLFLDLMHPTPEGHRRLGQGLLQLLVEGGLLPNSEELSESMAATRAAAEQTDSR